MGKRTRAIQRKLKDVETLSEGQSKVLLPELTDNLLDLEEENE